MSANAIISAVNHRRNRRARAWLEGRAAAEEVLIVGATLDAANELARGVAKEKGAAWHRLTLSPLAAAIAAPVLATRGQAESLARSLGPSKIHVSLIIIDGIVDKPSIRTKTN